MYPVRLALEAFIAQKIIYGRVSFQDLAMYTLLIATAKVITEQL